MKEFDLNIVNPYLLDNLLSAADGLDLFAKEDVCDESGAVLLSAGKALRADVKEKLLGKTLKKPLETCIGAKNALKHSDICNEALVILEEYPLFSSVKKYFRRDAKALGTIYLDSLSLLLLSVFKQNEPKIFQHTVMVALVARIIGAKMKLDYYNMALLSQAALLHDVGELYVDNAIVNKPGRLTTEDWQALITHPIIGEKIVTECTDYAPEVARAIAEHQERSDGTGYPKRIKADQLGKLGNILLMSEFVAGMLAKPDFPIARGLLVIKFFYWQYPVEPLAAIHALLRRDKVKLEDEDTPLVDAEAVQNVINEFDEVVSRLTACLGESKSFDEKAVIEHMLIRFGNIKRAMNEMGMEYCFLPDAWMKMQKDNQIRFETNLMSSELAWCLRDISRDASVHLLEVEHEPSKELKAVLDKMSQASFA